MNLAELDKQVEALKARKAAEFESRRLAKEQAAEAVRRALEAQDEADPAPTETIQSDIERMFAGMKTCNVLSEEEFRAKSFKDVESDLKRWGFPARNRIQLFSWENPDQEEVFNSCKKLFCKVGAIVALVGERGTGKTTIAAQLAFERAWQDWDKARNHVRGTPIRFQAVPYRKMNDLISRYKSLYADFGSIETEELTEERNKLCKESDLLIIDELHDCDDQRMKDRVLTDIIDRCYSQHVDVLIISNQTPEQFNTTTSDSVLSRLHHHGMVIPCEWESWRDKLSDAHTRLQPHP